ncbi:Transcriptional regulator, LuxR family [Novosphingobium resinovorum]|uniref:Transcriptional regulator, LuxR family n=1 Tax=Novosphingobium resinovorum TaxID=158500 RepID=A0A031K1J6_9SPHN|nr:MULTISPECIES: LuxR family transcriptional regulator [Novosphingobium]EZP83105.1 Transcriptional regulator, LuxR family [Novosphingobium resinovorum]
MLSTPRNPQGAVADIATDALHHGLAELDAASDFAAAQVGLKAVAVAIGMPLLAWAPDVSRPEFDEHMDAFLRQEGWPDEVMALWWNRNAMLKSPLYIRCRTSGMPFVTGPSDNVPPRTAELRQIVSAINAMGVRSLITMPIHLPRGRVAMVTWGGSATKALARSVLAQTRTTLIAAAHLFMSSYLHENAGFRSSEEELARLTPREWQCLRLTAQGFREEQVATTIGLGSTTVRFHLDNVVQKLGAANRTHAVALAAQLGLLGSIG